MPMAPSVLRDGAADFLILPVMTAVAMKVFLDELARRHDGQYILMIYESAHPVTVQEPSTSRTP